MTTFTPVSGFVGGMMIGAAAVLMMLFSGRIAGISGILGRALEAPRTGAVWPLAFLVGLVLGPQPVAALQGPVPVSIGAPLLAIAVGGLLVGVGTRTCSGCTSGHGVCGLARGSVRSLTATATFMGVAVATVFVTRHVLGG